MDRQEQIMEAARECPKHNSSCNNAEYLAFINGAEWADQHPTPQKLADAYVSGFVDAIEQPSPWISVEERLPEENRKVIFGVLNGTYTQVAFGVQIDGHIQIWFGGKMKNPTHWMPIPPIEKGGEK